MAGGWYLITKVVALLKELRMRKGDPKPAATYPLRGCDRHHPIVRSVSLRILFADTFFDVFMSETGHSIRYQFHNKRRARLTRKDGCTTAKIATLCCSTLLP